MKIQIKEPKKTVNTLLDIYTAAARDGYGGDNDMVVLREIIEQLYPEPIMARGVIIDLEPRHGTLLLSQYLDRVESTPWLI